MGIQPERGEGEVHAIFAAQCQVGDEQVSGRVAKRFEGFRRTPKTSGIEVESFEITDEETG